MLTVLFFFNDTATTEIYTLSLHDALPISGTITDEASGPPLMVSGSPSTARNSALGGLLTASASDSDSPRFSPARSEEHTSELQSRQYLVCRLLLEKKKTFNTSSTYIVSLP